VFALSSLAAKTTCRQWKGGGGIIPFVKHWSSTCPKVGRIAPFWMILRGKGMIGWKTTQRGKMLNHYSITELCSVA